MDECKRDTKPWFQLTAARRRLEGSGILHNLILFVSTHSRPKAAGKLWRPWYLQKLVSTHSRPKAAGYENASGLKRLGSFNSQPPEGGWLR